MRTVSSSVIRAFDEAHQHRRRNQEGRVGEPLQLQPLDPGGAPEAHAHRPRRRDQRADGAEEDERPQPFDRGQRGDRARHVLVWRIELLGREELDHEQARERHSRAHGGPSPARGRQPAVREDQGDRRHRREEQRPQRMVREHRPAPARKRTGVLQHRVLGIRLRETEEGNDRAVGQHQPADRIPRLPDGNQEPDPHRREHHQAERRVLPPWRAMRAGECAQHRRQRAHGDGQGRDNPGPYRIPAHESHSRTAGAGRQRGQR